MELNFKLKSGLGLSFFGDGYVADVAPLNGDEKRYIKVCFDVKYMNDVIESQKIIKNGTECDVICDGKRYSGRYVGRSHIDGSPLIEQNRGGITQI